jgi:hypothetical protein
MNDRTISKQTTVTLGLVIGLCVFITAMAFRIGTAFEKAAGEREAVRKDVGALRQELTAIMSERWTQSEAASYHDMLDRLNDDVEFPPIPSDSGK